MCLYFYFLDVCYSRNRVLPQSSIVFSKVGFPYVGHELQESSIECVWEQTFEKSKWNKALFILKYSKISFKVAANATT